MHWLVALLCLTTACGKPSSEDPAAQKHVAYAKAQIAKVEAAIASGDQKLAANECGLMEDYSLIAAADKAVADRTRIVCERDRLVAGAKADIVKLEAIRTGAKPGIECDEMRIDLTVGSIREDVTYMKTKRGIQVETDEAVLTDLEKRYKIVCP